MLSFTEFLKEEHLDPYSVSMDFIEKIGKALGLKLGDPTDVRFKRGSVMLDCVEWSLEANKMLYYINFFLTRDYKKLIGFEVSFSDSDKNYQSSVATTFKKVEDILKKNGVNVSSYKKQTYDGYMDNEKGAIGAFDTKTPFAFKLEESKSYDGFTLLEALEQTMSFSDREKCGNAIARKLRGDLSIMSDSDPEFTKKDYTDFKGKKVFGLSDDVTFRLGRDFGDVYLYYNEFKNKFVGYAIFYPCNGNAEVGSKNVKAIVSVIEKAYKPKCPKVSTFVADDMGVKTDTYFYAAFDMDYAKSKEGKSADFVERLSPAMAALAEDGFVIEFTKALQDSIGGSGLSGTWQVEQHPTRWYSKRGLPSGLTVVPRCSIVKFWDDTTNTQFSNPATMQVRIFTSSEDDHKLIGFQIIGNMADHNAVKNPDIKMYESYFKGAMHCVEKAMKHAPWAKFITTSIYKKKEEYDNHGGVLITYMCADESKQHALADKRFF